MTGYAHDKHYEWIESAHKVKCSDLGKQVANILGYVGRGIYNAPFKTEKVDWTNKQWIEVNWERSMSNWDGCQLSNLVIECHRRMIRVSIQPNMRSMKIMFHQRNTRDIESGISERMPDMEEMVRIHDADYGRPAPTDSGKVQEAVEVLENIDNRLAWAFPLVNPEKEEDWDIFEAYSTAHSRVQSAKQVIAKALAALKEVKYGNPRLCANCGKPESLHCDSDDACPRGYDEPSEPYDLGTAWRKP